MANTYSWVISSLDCAPEIDGKKDVVSRIHWRRVATDGVNTADIYGAQKIALSDADPFVNYGDLTENDVIQWLTDSFGSEELANMDNALDLELISMAAPVVITPALPW